MVVAKPVKRHAGASDHLAALADLLQDSRTDSAHLFEHGLALLVRALGVDRALLTRVTHLGYEVFWWAVSPRATMTAIFEAPEKGFCPFVIAHPARPLAIPDAAAEPRWRKAPGYAELGIRAYAGVAMKMGDHALGTLCVQHHAPRTFTKAEISLLRTIGQLMARALEAEHLKQELRAVRDALELSGAVVEDSALLSPRSGLPNRRYLDIWLRSTLFMARRRREPIALALWSQPMLAGIKGRLGAFAGQLRGGDLLAELSADRYLLLLPNTSDTGAEVVLTRLRETMGHHPIGVTLWLSDRQDMTLKSALRRVTKALADANREGSAFIWNHG